MLYVEVMYHFNEHNNIILETPCQDVMSGNKLNHFPELRTSQAHIY